MIGDLNSGRRVSPPIYAFCLFLLTAASGCGDSSTSTSPQGVSQVDVTVPVEVGTQKASQLGEEVASESRSLELDQELEFLGVVIRITDLVLSESKTRITYDLEVPDGQFYEPIGQPILSYGAVGVVSEDAHGVATGTYALTFPAVATGTDLITITFPRYRALTGPRADFELLLPSQLVRDSGGPTLLNEVVEVAGRLLRFTSLDVDDSEFELSYEPFDDESGDLELAGPGLAFEIVRAKDDLGNIFSLSGASTNIDEGTGTVRGQSLSFSGVLEGTASRLTITADRTGLVGPVPFEFDVHLQDGGSPTGDPSAVAPEAALQTPAAIDFEEAFARKCKETEQWSDLKPGFVMINQVQKHEGVPIRLVQGRFTPSETVLEFEIQHPSKKTSNYRSQFRILDRNIEGADFILNSRGGTIWGCWGKELKILEGLGPLDDLQIGIEIEFPRILMRNDESQEIWDELEGPWVFAFSPTEFSAD